MEEYFLSLHLLGEANIARNGEPLHFRGQTEAALLIYLAQTGQTHSREAIADMLWEARTTSQSLSNLRTALARLRPLADDALVITRKTLAYEPAARLQIDSVRLQEGLGQLSAVSSDADAARLRQVLRLYKGDFLSGFHLPAAPRFNDWVVVAGERLRQTLFTGYQRLLDYALARGDLELGIETAAHWLVWDELNETTHRHLIRLLAQSGRPAAAVAQYEQCVALLAAELGVAPQKATTALYEQLRQGTFQAATQPLFTRRQTDHNLPRELTPFFGRGSEIEEVTQRIRDPAYPLVTLTGEGGIGKTRLALAVARSLLEAEHPFADGVWFVSLAEVRYPNEPVSLDTVREEVTTTIGGAIGMVFHGQRTPSQQVIAFLKEKASLLILDNFEPLLDSGAVDWLLQLLQEASRVHLLITSRVALDLNSEWTVRLDGLPTPERASSDSSALPNEGLLQPDAESYDSVRLFAERAGRSATAFRLTEELAEVSAICRLVEGLPLAIELAAALARRLSCAEIAAALRANMNLLATKRRDVPARQRSIRAIFEYSWQLLDEAEQRLLAHLSVFRGGFQQEAACAVIDGPAWRLNGLERHSLLRQDDQGRYRLHPLLCEYAAEKLALLGAEQTSAVERYSAYYLESVGALTSAGRGLPEQLATMQVELDNIRRAWRWATKRTNLTALNAGWQGLTTFYFRRALFQEGEEAFGSSLERLQGAEGDRVDGWELTLARLRVAQATFLNALNRYDQAIDLAQVVLGFVARARNGDDVNGRARALLQAQAELAWGTARYRQGKFEQALGHLTMGMEASRRAGLLIEEAMISRRIGTTLLEKGDFAGAHPHLQRALAIFRQSDDRMGEGNVLGDLGWLSHRQQKLDEALAYDQRAYEIQLEIDNRHGAGMALINMAAIHEMKGDFSEAYACRQQVLRFLRDIDDRYHRSLVYHGLGVQLSRLGENEAAKDYYERSLAINRELGDGTGVAWTSNNLGLLYNHLGQFEMALKLHQSALEISQKLGARTAEGLAHLRMGQDFYGLGQFNDAARAYKQALDILLELEQTVWAMETRGGLARVLLELGAREVALEYVEPVLTHLAEKSLAGAREPLLLYWNCYVVLRANADARAPTVLEEAYALLRRQSQKIEDTLQRRSYFNNIKSHRDIIREMSQA